MAAAASVSTGGSTAIARSAAAAACASTDGSAGTARIAVAACGLMHPRACWISSATLVACVKYASVCASLGGRNSHGRRPARGRASFSGGEVDRGNGNLERASDVFRGKKAPLLGARLGKFRPKKAPLRIRSSQKRPFSYMHFPANKQYLLYSYVRPISCPLVRVNIR